MKEGKQSRKAGRQRRPKWNRIIVAALSPVVVIAAALIAAYLWKQRPDAEFRGLEISLRDDTLSIGWEASSEMDICRLFCYDEAQEEYLPYGEYKGDRIILNGVESGEELLFRLQAVRYVDLFERRWEFPGACRELTVVPVELGRPVLVVNADPEGKTADVSWQTETGNGYEVYLLDEQDRRQFYAEADDGVIQMRFDGEEGLPDREQPVRIVVRAVRREKDYVLYGEMSDVAVIRRADLLDGDMALDWERLEERMYVLRWKESKGAWYELQQWSEPDRKWISKGVFDWKADMRYETGRLPSCTQVRFRVITYNDPERRGQGQFAAEPCEIAFRTERSALYCTIWPLVPLDVTEDAQGQNVVGQVAEGQALCVLGETDGRFLIRYGEQYGYIDARFCMIDLPEYLGNLCEYDITNSFQSIFRVHGYDIPDITDQVVKGYEGISLDGNGFLVPYLYPCAQKLYEAALVAEEDGYCLRIYDAFRPNEATRYLYDTVETLLDEPVPEEEDGSGETAGQEVGAKLSERALTARESLSPAGEETLKGMTREALEALAVLPPELLQNLYAITPEFLALSEAETAAALGRLTPEDIASLQGIQAEDMAVLQELTWDELFELKQYLETELTYRKVMTDNRYRLSAFLAAAVSAHNRGIALDLTLVDQRTGETLEMQSDMHDLSWHSVLAQNNENARLLSQYMKGAGFHDLSSEWWHFQDDETREKIGLHTYLTKGLTAAGWKKDDTGWRYRLADGSYYRDTTVTVEGKSCTFDEKGYCIQSAQ